MPDWSPAQQVLLVVYAVLWAGILRTFGRLRVFAINDLFTRSDWSAWRKRFARFVVGILIGNVAPVLLLVLLLLRPPDPGNWWGIIAAALAGISPVAFPRFLHAAIASNETWSHFYADSREYAEVLDEWDKPRCDDALLSTNTWYSHLFAGLFVLLPSLGLAYLINWIL